MLMKKYIGAMLITIMLSCVGDSDKHKQEVYPVSKRITNRDIINAGLDELGYDHAFVMVRPLPHKFKEAAKKDGKYRAAFIIGGQGTYLLFLDTEIPSYLRYKVIAHELIHLEQLQTKRLKILGTTYVEWEGVLIPDITEIPYNRRGWEIEAKELSVDLERKIRKRLKQ
jgi:hypothetical protein